MTLSGRRELLSQGIAASALAIAPSPLLARANRSGPTYYVDAATGDDRNAGTAPSRAWKSLERLQSSLPPGSTIMLRRGCTWKEPLILRHAGAPGRPIRVAAYGKGPMPHIAVDGDVENAIALHNVSHVHVSGLEVSNRGDGKRPRRGCLIDASNIGVVRDIRISDLFIHDVTGTNVMKENGGIVFRTQGDRVATRFEGLVIERNMILRVDRSGIFGWSDQLSPQRWFPSTGVVIRDNYLEDIGGDGIVPWTTLGCVVEHNIVRKAVQRAPGANVGIWQWSTDNTLIQLNDVAMTGGTRDGQGYDSDYNSRGTAFRYNYSRENEGGFLLVCTPSSKTQTYNIGNWGTIAERNISRHDKVRTFHLAGGTDVRISRNAIYTAAGEDVAIVLFSDWEGWARDVTFSDNLFAAGGSARYGHGLPEPGDTGRYRLEAGWGGASEVRFAGNRYLGTQISQPESGNPASDAPRPLSDDRDWIGPVFDTTRPADFDRFLAAHRQWMLAMMTDQFGAKPDLAARVTGRAPLAPRSSLQPAG